MIDVLNKEKEKWICLTLKINLLIFQVRFKSRANEFYRSFWGGNSLLGQSNCDWLKSSFDGGFYRSSIMGNYVNYVFFLRMTEEEKINSVVRQLNIRVRKLGAFSVEVNDIGSIQYTDLKLLSSPSGMNAYQKILGLYSK
jgi:hypothetical protein